MDPSALLNETLSEKGPIFPCICPLFEPREIPRVQMQGASVSLSQTQHSPELLITIIN